MTGRYIRFLARVINTRTNELFERTVYGFDAVAVAASALADVKARHDDGRSEFLCYHCEPTDPPPHNPTAPGRRCVEEQQP